MYIHHELIYICFFFKLSIYIKWKLCKNVELSFVGCWLETINVDLFRNILQLVGWYTFL